MTPRSNTPRTWLFLLFAGFLLRASLAAGQAPPFPPRSHLTPDARSRLAEAARDSTLEPWQREFMLEVVHGKPTGAAIRPALALPGVALRTTGTPADDGSWIAIPPPSGRYTHSAIYDPVRDRMVVFGGGAFYNYRNDVWALAWDGLVSVPGDADAFSRRFSLAPPRPNPSSGETTVDFELEHPARVVLDVFDACGRRVKRIADEWFTPGRHALPWRGDDEGGRVLGSGVYFIHMQGGGFQATRRTTRVR